MTTEPQQTPEPSAFDQLLEVLEVIAAIPLSGEDIADEELREEFIETAEYDETAGKFQPTTDTEINNLNLAVWAAREAVLIARRRK